MSHFPLKANLIHCVLLLLGFPLFSPHSNPTMQLLTIYLRHVAQNDVSKPLRDFRQQCYKAAHLVLLLTY